MSTLHLFSINLCLTLIYAIYNFVCKQSSNMLLKGVAKYKPFIIEFILLPAALRF